MRSWQTLTTCLIAASIAVSGAAVAADPKPASEAPRGRQVIVSHADEKGVLQLFRVREDGSGRRQLTFSASDSQMPSCSPDGRRLVYVRSGKHGLSLRVSDVDGTGDRAVVKEGANVLPSWAPDSRHVVWMKTLPGRDPSRHAEIHLLNTESGESRRLFTDPDQLRFRNSMPVISPQGDRIAFVSDRSGQMRIWVSDLDGSNARLASPPTADYHETIEAPIEQKVPAWSPDGAWIAHWEGVEMLHMSRFTGVPNPRRDQLIAATFSVWVVSADGATRRKVGRGDDPTWSPDGFVTRAFPDPERGGPKVMVETDSGEQELPIVPRRRNWGRFTWLPPAAPDSQTN